MPLKNIPLGFIKLILIFVNIMKKKIQVDKNGCQYILFRIDVYFNKFLSAVEIDENEQTERDLPFWGKKTSSTRKKLGCKFIRINTNDAKNGYDFHYEVGNINAFIEKKKLKKKKKKKKKKINNWCYV